MITQTRMGDFLLTKLYRTHIVSLRYLLVEIKFTLPVYKVPSKEKAFFMQITEIGQENFRKYYDIKIDQIFYLQEVEHAKK
jgi:hypothetical protein